jgi:hypothetical protein
MLERPVAGVHVAAVDFDDESLLAPEEAGLGTP